MNIYGDCGNPACLTGVPHRGPHVFQRPGHSKACNYNYGGACDCGSEPGKLGTPAYWTCPECGEEIPEGEKHTCLAL